METASRLPCSPRKRMLRTSIRPCRPLMRLLLVQSVAGRSVSVRTRAMTARSLEVRYANEVSNLPLTIETLPTAACRPNSGTIERSVGMRPVAGRWNAPLPVSISNGGSTISGSIRGRSMKVSCPSRSFVVMQRSSHDAEDEFLDGLIKICCIS